MLPKSGYRHRIRRFCWLFLACLTASFASCSILSDRPARKGTGEAGGPPPLERQLAGDANWLFADLPGSSSIEGEFREWDFGAPTNVRPCCAFGVDLSVGLGGLPLAGVRIANVVSPEDLGTHEFDIPLMSLRSLVRSGSLASERNGLVYTCRGGFIDIAHVRDYADRTVYLAGVVEAMVERGGVIELPDEGGHRYVYLTAVDPALIAQVGLRELSVEIAEWLAFHLSVWHEVATWLGWSSWAAYPEIVSAFSPEDFYSNALGVRLAGAIVRSATVMSRAQYNQNLDAALVEILRRLEAVDEDLTHQAAFAVDGLWWDSTRRLPESQLLLRRNFAVRSPLWPWLVSQESEAVGRSSDLEARCESSAGPVGISYPASIGGVPLRQLARLDLRATEGLAVRASQLSSRWLGQDDLVDLVDLARFENELLQE